MAPKTDPGLDATKHREVGVALFNHVWTLLDLDGRTGEQDMEMVHTAHASAYHWMQVGTAENRARSEWQCSRVYAVLGRSEPAIWHAQQCLGYCERAGIGDWDLAFAYEALARAHAVAGDREETARWLDRARQAAADIAEDGDRQLVLSDLETIPTVA
ncbi:MAG: hypothetical protein QOC82_1492 [Frankiaceae bacterium]|jgi:hypothetical protein|nr:hypothetical protein [Frankiaceae bacterium]